MKKTVFRSVLALLILLPSLAQAQDVCGGSSSDVMAEIAQSARDSATEVLASCAAAQGLKTSGQATLTIAAGTSAAIIPLAGVESLTREDLDSWQTIGLFAASPPDRAEAPGGTFIVRVKAPKGSSTGNFQIVDESGKVVQEGELTVAMNTSVDSAGPASSLATNPGALGSPSNASYPYCYYPYGPYFGLYPYYYYGCYWWTYGWGWGYIRFHYCWWPFHPYCWWYYPCWWW
jgi:hypothetical protein